VISVTSNPLPNYCNLTDILWDTTPIPEKAKLRKIIFPGGIIYDGEKKRFRIEKIRLSFRWIAALNGISGLKEKGQNGVNSILSN